MFYAAALGSKRFINRSEAAVKECRQYQYNKSGEVVNARAALAKGDLSGARSNHADRPVADALACKFTTEYKAADTTPVMEVPVGSLAYYRREEEERQRMEEEEW